MTSPMRQAVIAAMTSRSARDVTAARALAVELCERGYPERDDDDLFDLAGRVGVAQTRLDEIALLDATLRPERDTAMCAECRDTGSVTGPTGRYVRCHTCNPETAEDR